VKAKASLAQHVETKEIGALQTIKIVDAP